MRWRFSDFRHNVADLWRRALRRRGQKRAMTWQRTTVLQDRWLPRAHITQPWPERRFAVKHPRWEPGAGIPPAGICAGCALKAHETMSPEMATAVKPSRQPRTEFLRGVR